ncbi:MAG: transglutaminase family protein [Pseudooceanicola sp.]
MTVDYDIRLTITHSYAAPVGNCRHVIRVLPMNLGPEQTLRAHLLEVSPRPAEQFTRLDFFGNHTLTVTHPDPHSEMEITMSARVSVNAPPPLLDTSPDTARLSAELADYRDLGPASPMHFLGPSPRLSANAEIAAFAREACAPGASAVSDVIRLGEALHGAMQFDATATDVHSDPVDAFRQRAGVCQDFTHIMILGLRALGIPAGYVSGYLRTLPPPGQARLEGADAMHAWVRAWCGASQGWIEYDPTNATLVAADHIVAARGRDYADVSPVRGFIRTSGSQVHTQSVDVAPVE